MRLQSATQREFPFPAGQLLVSTTDLKGRILHANAVFVATSGYTLDELLGQPHNILRHPDVPEEAFRDMWATIQAGQPWSGLVKNRRKDGDHYWVLANVTPLLDGGRPVAYLSVRSQPTRAQVDATEALFARMREEARAGRLRHRLRAGEIVTTGWAGAWAGLRRRAPWLGEASAHVAVAMLGTLAYAAAGPWVAAGTALAAGGALAAWRDGGRRTGLRKVEAYANALAAGDLAATLERSGRPQLRGLEASLAQVGVNLRDRKSVV